MMSSSAGLNGRIAAIMPVSSGPKKSQPRAMACGLTRISTLRRSVGLLIRAGRQMPLEADRGQQPRRDDR